MLTLIASEMRRRNLFTDWGEIDCVWAADSSKRSLHTLICAL
ncbi:MAG: hypothetical protein ACTS4W_01060 [Candidatus Hodgkinia cicadicola]